jgi:hypothetical protein
MLMMWSLIICASSRPSMLRLVAMVNDFWRWPPCGVIAPPGGVKDIGEAGVGAAGMNDTPEIVHLYLTRRTVD